MYSPDDMIPVIRSERERQNPHPVFGAYMDMRYSRNMARDEAREKVIPTYMGLITQIDDQMGVLMKFLEERDLVESTMIVFTSDHGDYLGDHWMGEKDLFHEQSAKIPLIIIDPSKEADATRGKRSDALVEGIDLAPTFVDYFGGKVPGHILEGRSLLPLLRGPDAAGLAQGRVLRIRLFHAGRPAEIEPADRALPPVHGVRRPLEIHPCLRLPPDAV
ncbi:arylsulfatase A-like enzyme [Bradyrhizobium sp. LB1.3]